MMPPTAPLCLARLLHLTPILLLLSVPASTTEFEWRQTAFLDSLNRIPRDNFGRSVEIDDGIVVVGAYRSNLVAFNAGAAFIYSSVDGEWSEEAVLTVSDAAEYDFFGYSVAVSNGIVAVGAPLDDNAGGRNAGAVYVYVREEDGPWTKQAKILGSNGRGNDNFGWAVSIHGSTLIAGAPNDNDRGRSSGSVYVFKLKDGIWTEQAKLTASDGSAGDKFGWSASLHGDWIVVGSFLDDDLGDASGSAYLFELMADGTWTEQAKLVPSDGETDDRFGWSVDIFGDYAAIGAPGHDVRFGAAYLFTMVSGAWTEQAILVSSEAAIGDQLGHSLSVGEETLLAGALYDDAGSASLFTRDGDTWTEARFTPNRADPDNRFGDDVAFDQGTVVIGFPGFISGNGTVYIYEASPSMLEPTGFPTLPPTNVPTYETTATPSSMVDVEPSALPTIIANPGCERVVIDFEEFASGNRPFNLGYGVRVRGDGNRARHGVMIFDTANPTGEDEDLASEDLGKILILSEDVDSTDPDDNMLGGYIRFTFNPPISEVISVDLKDFDARGSSIRGKHADGSVFSTISIDPSEDGGEQTVMIGESNVGRLKINLAGSGGIDNLTLIYCEP